LKEYQIPKFQALVHSYKLKQKDFALQSLDKALILWQDYFSIQGGSVGDEDGKTSLALINLIRVDILKTMPKNSTDTQQKLLASANSILMPLITKTSNNYKTIAIYLQILKQSNDFGSDNELETRLRDAHYQNPDFAFTSYSNDLKNISSRLKVEISLSKK